MFLLIDKSKSITSHDVVDEIRKITGVKKVGHAGTLDPNATGLLIIAVGRESTKKLGLISKKDKRYDAEIFLGEERDTDDAVGKIIFKKDVFSPPTKAKIEKVLTGFIGKIKQTPPDFSAIKVKGRRAYKLSRKGQKPNLKSREINIHNIKLISYRYPALEIEVDVSSGTYIRALARDMGKALATGAYLEELRRVSIGNFSVDNAVSIEKLSKDNWKNYAIELD